MSADLMKSNLAGLYIQIEAKKRRINIINLWKVPKLNWPALRRR
jgi:hypothetical protein